MRTERMLTHASYADGPAPRLALPSAERAFLGLVLLVSGTFTAPQIVSTGGTSGLGLWTLGVAGAGLVLWARRPYFPRELLGVLLPLLLFNGWACLSMVWGGDSVPSVQILAVGIGFVGLTLIAAREAERRPATVASLNRALDAASVTAAVLYGVVVLREGQGGDLFVGGRPFLMGRPFALFACVAVGRQLARWQAGRERGLWIAVGLTVMVFLSQSRLALAVCVALFPLSFIARGDGKSVRRGLGVAAVGVAALGAAVMLYRPMYERMFAYDAKISVGGVAVNASGRTEMWKALLDDIHGSVWLFGHGIGSSSRRIDKLNPALGHPHNDFLRYLYDTGACGLAMFCLFLLAALLTTAAAVRRAARQPVVGRSQSAGDILAVHLAPLLGLVTLVAAMCTDNPISYVYVMAPLAILLGCSLGQVARERRLTTWRRAGVGRNTAPVAAPAPAAADRKPAPNDAAAVPPPEGATAGPGNT